MEREVESARGERGREEEGQGRGEKECGLCQLTSCTQLTNTCKVIISCMFALKLLFRKRR